ncbi:MAG: chemotaxis protein CheW [Syntrophothermus sp.]
MSLLEIKAKAENTKLPYVICRVKKQLIGISTEYVKELVHLPNITPLPNMPPEIRGIINSRGSVIHVHDLRMRLNMEPSTKELNDLIQLLHEREQDHKNWLNELEQSTKDNRPFKLTTDPHKCAFGKWYNSFTTSNFILSAQLEKFDAPHKTIHSIAIDVEKMKAAGNFEGAFAIIEKTRETELKLMVSLFEETRQLLVKTHREMAVILEVNGKSSALAVDQVVSVEPIEEGTIAPISSEYQQNSMAPYIAQRIGSGQFIYLLDPYKLSSDNPE